MIPHYFLKQEVSSMFCFPHDSMGDYCILDYLQFLGSCKDDGQEKTLH